MCYGLVGGPAALALFVIRYRMLLVMPAGAQSMTFVLAVPREQCRSGTLEWCSRTLERTGGLPPPPPPRPPLGGLLCL